jgi:hypothetical protein
MVPQPGMAQIPNQHFGYRMHAFLVNLVNRNGREKSRSANFPEICVPVFSHKTPSNVFMRNSMSFGFPRGFTKSTIIRRSKNAKTDEHDPISALPGHISPDAVQAR